VPTAWTTGLFGRADSIAQGWQTTSVKYKLNETIPDSTFQLSYPPGTWVRDYITNETYILLEGGKKRPILPGEFDGKNYEELLHSKPASSGTNGKSGKPSTAKPTNAVSPASGQPATKGGGKTDSKSARPHSLTNEPTDQGRAIAEIEKLGGRSKSPGKPVVSTHLTSGDVTDARLEYLKATTELQMLILASSDVTEEFVPSLFPTIPLDSRPQTSSLQWLRLRQIEQERREAAELIK
jgi:hypothetical protein